MSPADPFREFEHAGWEDASVCSHYDEELSAVTRQSVEPLLDAAGVGGGTRIVDVATGAGYVAGSAAERRAVALGLDFSSAQVALARRRYPAVRFATS